jgi:hypothetical protein
LGLAHRRREGLIFVKKHILLELIVIGNSQINSLGKAMALIEENI